MRVVSGGLVPIRIWARHIDDDALKQLRWLADQPWVVEAVCAMPDVHVSHGVAVGTVFATRDVVAPFALGGDLGCGIAAVCVPGAAGIDREHALDLLSSAIPVGDAVHRRGAPYVGELSTRALTRALHVTGGRQLGTLGGGNHFVELDRDVDGDLWILVHSGSRGVGSAIAEHHGRVGASVLPLDGAGAAYLRDLEVALTFAADNRKRMLDLATSVVFDLTGCEPTASTIDVHHNHASFSGELLIHRKGAIAAPVGARAVIPGSMATASYIVEGCGNPLSFSSASHGAGRRLTRTAARKTLSNEAVARALRGVSHRVAGDVREEAPQAYRDIREVLEDEQDLVTPLLRIEPIAVLKG